MPKPMTLVEWERKTELFRENAKARLQGHVSDYYVDQIDLAYKQQIDPDYRVPEGYYRPSAQPKEPEEEEEEVFPRDEIDDQYKRKARLVKERTAHRVGD